jgi:hypothetical protein
VDTTQLPVRPLINPLTSEDESLLRSVLERHYAHADLIERAKQCGLDMSQQESRNQLHGQVAKAALELFFPTTIVPPEE